MVVIVGVSTVFSGLKAHIVSTYGPRENAARKVWGDLDEESQAQERCRRPDVRTGGEAPRPEGLDRVENAGSPAAREAALAEDAARSGDSRALAGGVPAQDASHREDNLPPESDSGGEGRHIRAGGSTERRPR